MDISKEVINSIKIIELNKLNSKSQNEITTPFSNEVEKVIVEKVVIKLKSEFLVIYKQVDKLKLEKTVKEAIVTNTHLVILPNHVIETNKLGLMQLTENQKFELQNEGVKLFNKFSDNKIFKVKDKNFVKIKANIYEINTLPEELEKTIYIALEYKKSISEILTLITNIQLEKFVEFISNLPKKHSELKDYFRSEEQKDGFFKETAYKKVVNKGKLVEKFQNSYGYNYEKIEQNVYELQAYLGSYEYICGIPKSDLLGQDYYPNYGYDNI